MSSNNTASSSSSSSKQQPLTMNMNMMECHSLPCSVEYTGPLPTANVYFQPADIMAAMATMDVATTSTNNDKDEETTTTTTDKKSSNDDDAAATTTTMTESDQKKQQQPTIQAACLRGRGLLSQVPQKASTSLLQGRLLRIDNKESSSQVHVEAAFDSIQEWHHEHDVAALLQAVQQQQQQQNNNNNKTSISRIQTAMDWCQVAQALHAPLPIILQQPEK